MAVIKPGSVVICEFPYTDGSRTKTRPVLVLSTRGSEDFIGSLITTASFPDSIPLTKKEFVSGGLKVEPCYLVPLRVSAVSKSIIKKEAGIVHHSVLTQAIKALVDALGK